MDLKTIFLYVLSTVSGVYGFYGSWFGSDSSENSGFNFFDSFGYMQYNSLRFSTKRCYIFVDKTYLPGEFIFVVQTDSPTISFSSNNFISFESKNQGKEYTITNTRIVNPGYQCLRYTLRYFWWRHPHSWCFRPEENTSVMPFTTETPRATTRDIQTTSQMTAKTSTVLPETTQFLTKVTTPSIITVPNKPVSSHPTIKTTSDNVPTTVRTTTDKISTTTRKVIKTSQATTTELITPTTPPSYSHSQSTLTNAHLETSTTHVRTSPTSTTHARTQPASTTPRTLPTRKPLPSLAR